MDLAVGPVDDVVLDTNKHNVSSAPFCTASYSDIIPNNRAAHKEIPELTPRQIERFWAKVQKTDGCWFWEGYSAYANPAKTIFYGVYCGFKVHRIAYTLQYGPIPPDYTLDHVKARGCVSTLCVRPDHLEPVTMQEQIRRRDEGRVVGGLSVCKWGHIRPAGRKAKCPECARHFVKEAIARRYAKNPEATKAKWREDRKRQRATAKAKKELPPRPEVI